MLLVLLLFLWVTLFADLLVLGGVFAAFVFAILALGDCFVAAGGFLLAFFAGFLGLVSLDTTFMVTILTCSFRFNTTALSSEDGAGGEHQRYSKGQSRQCSVQLHFYPFLSFLERGCHKSRIPYFPKAPTLGGKWLPDL